MTTRQLLIAIVVAAGALAHADHQNPTDHHGIAYEITCRAHNVRGQRFVARGVEADWFYVREAAREVQHIALDNCQFAGSWVCVADGCTYRRVYAR